jgi:hypothetical protein
VGLDEHLGSLQRGAREGELRGGWVVEALVSIASMASMASIAIVAGIASTSLRKYSSASFVIVEELEKKWRRRKAEQPQSKRAAE